MDIQVDKKFFTTNEQITKGEVDRHNANVVGGRKSSETVHVEDLQDVEFKAVYIFVVQKTTSKKKKDMLKFHHVLLYPGSQGLQALKGYTKSGGGKA